MPHETQKFREITAVFLFALALLSAFMLWAPLSMTGILGQYCSALCFGLIGVGAYLLPFFFAYSGFEVLKEKKSGDSFGRRICILLLVLCLVTLISVLTLDNGRLHQAMGAKNEVATQALQVFYKAGLEPQLISPSHFWSGGVWGSLTAYSLRLLTGFSGALIIVIAMFLALLVLAFNLSYKRYFSKTKAGVLATRRRLLEAQEAYRRRRQARQEEALAQAAQAEAEEQAAAERRAAEARAAEERQARQEAERRHGFAGEQLERNTAQNEKIGSWPSFLNEAAEPGADDDAAAATAPPFDPDPLEPNRDNIRPVILQRPETATTATMSPAEVPSADSRQAQTLNDNVAPTAAAKQRSREVAGQTEQRVTDRAHWDDRNQGAGNAEQLSRHEVKKAKRQASLLQAYIKPPFKILNEQKNKEKSAVDREQIVQLGHKLEETLLSFGVDAKVSNFISGPTISRFELVPGPGVKVSKIVNLSDDIALSLAAIAVRIEAPIPGKSAIGIEIPNKKTEPVLLRPLLEDPAFQAAESPLTAVLGRDIQGQPILCDLAKMPHLLIAGATGSGKSVCINSILISLLYRSGPDKLRLLMIDPKVVELSVYNGIPHLLQPVVTDPKKAYGALDWAVTEMNRRYNLFATHGVRDFKAFNELHAQGLTPEEENPLPLILVVIDELSDLMQTTASEVEARIARLTAMARAAGIHLIIATQRPSVDVITGTIKSNIPSRISFAVSSQVDSRTILDSAGAEKLLGKGDMLYNPQSANKPIRGQGAFVTDAEVERVIQYLKNLYPQNYDDSVLSAIEAVGVDKDGSSGGGDSSDQDELFDEALKLVIETGYASTSLLQRRLNLGYPRASRIIDQLHEKGFIGPFEGSKPRKVLIKKEDYFARLNGSDE